MKHSIALLALLMTGFVAASTEQASAVVYCQYVAYPVGCVVRPGVVLRPRPVARAVVTPGVGAAGVGVRPGTPMNRGGPVKSSREALTFMFQLLEATFVEQELTGSM